MVGVCLNRNVRQTGRITGRHMGSVTQSTSRQLDCWFIQNFDTQTNNYVVSQILCCLLKHSATFTAILNQSDGLKQLKSSDHNRVIILSVRDYFVFDG